MALKLMVTTKGISINKEAYPYLWPEGAPTRFLQTDSPPVVPCKNNTCRSETDYNLGKLSQTLHKIKQEAIAQNHFNQLSNHIVLIPDASIPYSILVKIMDATRGERDNKLFSSFAFAQNLR